MARDYTTASLINSLKLRASIPTSQTLFTDQDLVDFMTQEMHNVMVPAIHSVREEFFVTYEDTVLVGGQAAYDIPSRAVGAHLRDVQLVDSNGNLGALTRINPDALSSPSFLGVPYSIPTGFYIQGNKVYLSPTPSSSISGYSVRLKYERRPNDLCLIQNGPRITGIDSGTGVITLTGVPSGWTTSLTYDIISSVPHFNTIAENKSITAKTSNTVTMTTIPSGVAVDQYMAEAGFSPIPQIPYEGFFVLAQFGAAKALEAQNDDNATRVRDIAMKMLEDFLKVITPRVDGEAEIVVSNKSLFSNLQGGFWFRR